MDFMNPRKGRMTCGQMINDIQAFIAEKSDADYKIVIGTDSQTTAEETVFVTAVIVHRIGRGARFYTHKRRSQAIHQLRYRIYKETEASLMLMEYLKDNGYLQTITDLPLEIHLDVGQRGETRTIIQEVVGWVTATGYTVKIKPEAYGASAVADRFTK